MSKLFNIELGGSLRYTDRGVALYKDVFYKSGIDIQEIRTLKDHQRACDISNVDSVLNAIFQNRHLNPATEKPSLLAEAVNELLSGDVVSWCVRREFIVRWGDRAIKSLAKREKISDCMIPPPAQ